MKHSSHYRFRSFKGMVMILLKMLGLRGIYSFVLALVVVSTVTSLYLEQEWGQFKSTFNKSYLNDDEESKRHSIWVDNYKKIQLHNEEAESGIHSYWVKMNHFGDMETHEINKIMNTLHGDLSQEYLEDEQVQREYSIDERPTEKQTMLNETKYFGHNHHHRPLPQSIDWRTKGYVTPVKYQGHCGSCYAFSATGALEGQHYRKTGKLVSLSEQNIVDCTFYNKYRDHGCHGGKMDNAFRYIIAAGGVDTERSYPYTASVGKCKFNPINVGATARTFIDIPRGNERRLQEIVGTMGPVSVGVDAHGFGFHFYSHGVYDTMFCSSVKLNHGVLVVGYGRDECRGFWCWNKYQNYWLVKNSWGKWWGLDGYVKMSRDKNNQCGIATMASIPVV